MSGGYVVAGYGITVGSLGLYAVRVLRRGRALSRTPTDDVSSQAVGTDPTEAAPTTSVLAGDA